MQTTEPEVPEYRPLSALAIASLVLGLASVSALFYPLFWAVPLVAATCALLAMRQIRARPAELSGKTLAVIGLVLALLFVSWGATHHLVRRRTLLRHAEPIANEWLQRVLEGRQEEAHQMFLEPARRRPPGTDLKRYYREDDETRRNMETMFLNPCLKPMVEHGEEGKLSLQRVAEVKREDGVDFVTLEYLYRYEEDGVPQGVRFHLRLTRYYEPSEGIAMWSLNDVFLVGDLGA
jgi:hypothetical protein